MCVYGWFVVCGGRSKMSMFDGLIEVVFVVLVVMVVGMICMDVLGYIVWFCDGLAVINVGGDLYIGEDSVFGVIGGIL